MSENWKIQVSPKLTDGTLINLRAETPEEADNILNWAINNAAKIGEAVQAVNAVSVVAQSFPGAQVVVQPPAPAATAQTTGGGWSQQGTQQAPPAFVPQQGAPQAAPADEGLLPAPFCAHAHLGPMVLRRGKPPKRWVAYMCPTPQNTPGQCRPVDAKTGESWK